MALEAAKARYEARKECFMESCKQAEQALVSTGTSIKTFKACGTRVKRGLERVLSSSENVIDLLLKINPPPQDEIKIAENEQSDIVKKSEEILLALDDEIFREEPVAEPQNQEPREGQHHRLPKLELPKFGGEAREWLQFWSSFKTIHEDNTIPTTHKFQYLLNCMKNNSIAEEIVKSYPATAANYSEAILSLKERFGRDDMLVEVYVRDLIKLIMENAKQKSGSSFSSLYVQLSSQLRSLGSLGVTTDKCAAILYPIVESTLPEEIFVAWERYRIQNLTTTNTSESHLDALMTFLKHEVEGTERIRLARESFSTSIPATKQEKYNKKPQIATATSLVIQDTKQNPGCVFCGGKHSSEACCKAMSMSLEDRKKVVKENRRCFLCLRSGHQSKSCKATVKCISCGRKHWAILCPDLASKQSGKENKTDDKKTVESIDMANSVKTEQVLLQTTVLRVHGEGKSKLVRAMFDCGSSKSYILKDTAEEVNLKKIGEEHVSHILFGNVKTSPQRHNRYKVYLSNLDSTFSCNFDVSDHPNITAPLSDLEPGEWMEKLKQKGVIFNSQKLQSNKIELLIGSDVYVKLLTGRKVDLENGPSALETKFGWTVSGKVSSVANNTNHVLSFHTMDLKIKDLWDLDVIGIREPVKDKNKQEIEKAALQHFKNTVTRNDDGRYVVSLPWLEGHAPLPSYRNIASKKLQSTKERLAKQQVLEAYHNVFTNWEDSGIIAKVSGSTGHYISHHGVIKTESTTTPVRPVFNASFKTKGNPSLNDCLEVGPNMLEKIPSVLLRFRLGPVGITSDIEKAFLQIEVKKEDWEYLKFKWYKNSSCVEEQDFCHCRVPFGVSSSPFLLAATLDYHLSNCESKYSSTVAILKKSFYVDNSIASMSSVEEALNFKKEASELLQQAKMNLREWEIGPTTEEKFVSILGLTWNTKNDNLFCDLRGTLAKLGTESTTRRKMLSVAHSIFDPLGIVSPFTVIPKIILQETCKLKASWDTVLPDLINKKFQKWCDQIPEVAAVQIPRFVATDLMKKNWSLHIFTDASNSAFSACAYLRSGSPGKIKTNLLMSRSRVAPLKPTTIPRLELIGCLCGARLAETVKKIIELPDIPVTFWSDSTTALAWIQNEKNWSVFVANRVKEIRTLTNVDNWRHISGKENPADLPSRGCSVKNLLEPIWLEGPAWLKEEKQNWPTSLTTHNEDEVNKELKKTVISHVNVTDSYLLTLLNRRSDYRTIVRVFVYICRFLKKFSTKYGSKEQQTSKEDPITLEEFFEAETKLVKIIQSTYFAGVNDPKLKNLRAFQDNNGVIRIRTRLFPEEGKEYATPIVLPPKEPIVQKLIWKTHVTHCHAGVQFLVTELRQKYWIINARRTIRSVILSCGKCRRFRAQPIQVEQGLLPKDRLKVGPAFDVTGVDMAGPLHLKGNKKVWIALFTCASTRGVHLELCTGLSTEIFLAAFRRFIARRGRPTTVYSDNGLNFVGAANLIKTVDWNKALDYSINLQIKWKFNPPTASWWGGFWERMVGVVKQMLRTVLGFSRVNNEELQTLLCDIESVINNRPLTYISEENDLQPLTPNMFIRNCGLSIAPDLDNIDRAHLVSHYRNVQHCRDELRNRFRKEYLAMLVNNGKNKKSRDVKVGDVMLIGCDNQKRLNWPMGVIVEIFPGRDGHVRVAKLKTEKGFLLRPVQRLYPLEISSNHE